MSLEIDLEIVSKVLSGDVQSFEQIIQRYQERILRLCRSMVGASQAEDAAQEIFLKIYKSLSQFKEESSFSTWVYRIAANHCLNLIKKNKREQPISIESSLLEERGPSAQDVFEKRQMLQSIFKGLDPEDRMILTLREVEGFTYQEIAERLQISLDLVKVRLFRARQALIQSAKKFL